GFTVRLFCVATTTCRVSTSPGESIRGEPSRTVNSACCTTTGAVAVRPPAAVAWIVPWPGARATTLPLWSTLATSGRSDVHATTTGAAGEPAWRRARGARGAARVHRVAGGGAAGGGRGGGAGPGAGGWAGGGGRARGGGGGGGPGGGGGGGGWRTAAGDLDGGLPPAGADPGFNDGHTVRHAGDGAVVVDLRDVDVVGRPDDAYRGDDIPDAIERGREQTGAFTDADGHRGGRDLHL